MWPMLLLGLVGLTFAIERSIFLHKGKIRAGEFLAGIKNLLRKRRLVEALTVCEEMPTPVANVIKAALINHDQDEHKMMAAVQSAALVEMPNLQRRIGTISMIAKVAPLMGLLGTVVALFMGFQALEADGNFVSASLLSGFVAQSLITTATGLSIAVIAWVTHHFLDGRVRSIVHDMEWVAHDMLQFLLRDLPGEVSGEK